MNAYKKILIVSRERPVDREESLPRHTSTGNETLGRIIQRLLLPLTLALVIAVPGLLYPASAGATEALDQSQTVSQTSQTVGYDMLRAQIFTAGVYGVLDRVSLRLENYWSSPPTGAVLNISVQTVIDGVPSGKQIGSGTIALSAIPGYQSGGDWVDVNIRGAIMHPGTQYALVLQTTIWNAQVYWWLAYQNQYGSSYTRGQVATNYGSGWSTDGMYDFTFQTYVIPDVLDQSQYSGNYHMSVIGGSTLDRTYSLGQTFTAGLSGVLDRVSVRLGNVDATGPVEASIQTVTKGIPSGSVIGQGSIPASSLTDWMSWGSWVSIDISDAVVTAGAQYALVLRSGSGQFDWYCSPNDTYEGGDLMTYAFFGGWAKMYFTNYEDTGPGDAQFETYVAVTPPLAFAPPPPPATITPCSSGVCPAVSGRVTRKDSTARVASHVQFQERPDGTVHGILNFNDSKTGNFVLKRCTTDSAACRLTVTTFDCTDQHAIKVAGTYTPKGGTAAVYLLTLSGVRDGIGTFTLTADDYTYSLTLDGIVDVTCP